MHIIALSLLVLGFFLLANILVILMFCNIVEANPYSQNDLYQQALKLVTRMGGCYQVRIFCCFVLLPRTLFIIAYAFVLWKLSVF